MNYDIYYVNSEGQKIDFCNWPYMIYDGDILSYDWSYDSSCICGIRQERWQKKS